MSSMIGPDLSPGASLISGCAGLAGAAGFAAGALLVALVALGVLDGVAGVASPAAAAAACSCAVADCLLVPTALFALSMALCSPAWPGAVADAGEELEPLFGARIVKCATAKTSTAARTISTGLETW